MSVVLWQGCGEDDCEDGADSAEDDGEDDGKVDGEDCSKDEEDGAAVVMVT